MRPIAALPLVALALLGAKPADDIATAERLRDAALAGNHAYALVGLQFCLAAINVRGVYKNE